MNATAPMSRSRVLSSLALVSLLCAADRAAAQSKAEREARAAVERAVDWLVAHQDADGRWDSDGFAKHDRGEVCDGAGNAANDIGITGLAISTLLMSERPARAAAIDRGVRWLLRQHGKTGVIGPNNHHNYVICHGIATRALAEVAGLPGGEFLKGSLTRAADYIERHRNPYSAWHYQPRAGKNSTQVTGWMIDALVECQERGVRIEAATLATALTFLDSMTDQGTGRTGYQKVGEPSARLSNQHAKKFPWENGEAMTAVAILCRHRMGKAEEGARLIELGQELIDREPPRWSAKWIDYYYWYFGTLALRERGGRSWKAWTKALHGTLVSNQREDGNYAGSWDPVGVWGEPGGRIASTAMAAMALATTLPDVSWSRSSFADETRAIAWAGDLQSTDEAIVVRALGEFRSRPETAMTVVPRLLALLEDPSATLRAQAESVLAAVFGDAAQRSKALLADWRGLVKSSVIEEQLRAARLLWTNPNKAPTWTRADVVGLLDPSPQVRVATLERFSQGVEPRSLLPVYGAMLGDPDAAVRRLAADRWRRASYVDEVAAARLARSFATQDDASRCTTIDELGEVGGNAQPLWPWFLALVRSPEPELRTRARRVVPQVLPGLGDKLEQSVLAIEQQLGAKGAEQWRVYLSLLGESGVVRTENERLERIVLAACELRSPDAEVRRAAAAELAAMGPLGDVIPDTFGGVLGDPDAAVRAMAEQQLGALPPSAAMPGARGVLARMRLEAEVTEGTAGDQARLAVWMLAKDPSRADLLGEAAATLQNRVEEIRNDAARRDAAVAASLQALQGQEIWSRLRAALALGASGDTSSEVRAALRKELARADLVAHAARAGLEAMGDNGRDELVGALGEILGSDDTQRRQWSLGITSGMGRDALELAPAILDLLKTGTDEERAIGEQALRSMVPQARDEKPADDDRLASISDRLASPKQGTRAAAARGIKKLGAKAMPLLPDLIAALSDDNEAVRRRVAEAIGSMGPAAAKAIPALVVRLGDGDQDVAEAAREAIGDIIEL